jgi:DNA-binding PadR family transcriptional regulator
MAVYLGEFEQLVLLAILRLGDKASGAAIRDTVEEGSGRTVWIGAVYTTLERAEGKGLVYELEPDGKAALGHAYNTWLRMTRGIKPKLESL